ncbi:hypothetical protein HRG_007511 [Hirsutella rhossiliensis]|uniref:Uncharacterized protein n=1 Tax=Hirsutella rhossiliensis TaxID=111463 RepID=A0A9P8MSZ3_9HYPO|nr:uncharacterized protein HRG_07511 [Hirsutella rhossiliensis]KAH0961433.1 hypothetical protein HRG_07511 [Hirsutella rhossiliensis]
MMSASLMRSATATAALLLLVPVAVSAVRLNRAVRSKTTSHAGVRPSHETSHEASEEPPTTTALLLQSPKDPASLPAHVKSPQWVVAYERVVSSPVPISSLADPSSSSTSSHAQSSPSALLRRYMRATHIAFAWTPQAWLIRALVGDAHARRSFDTDWIDALAFAPGDLVNGVYKVACHEREGPGFALPERAELLIQAPATYRGPSVCGLLLAAIEPALSASADTAAGKGHEPSVVFVNETWMWRRAGEKPVLLETPLGKWFHGLLARWLVFKGLDAVVVAP